MSYYDLCWYVNAGNQSTTGYYAVALRPQNAAVTAGQIVRQFTAPAVNSERCFICIVAGTTANTTDATWVLTRGAKTTDGTATWQEVTGASAVNGDLTNTPTWAAAKAISSAVTLGAIIQRNNGASYWICSTAGSTGASEPAWANNTAGTTQTDSTVTWTCLGVVGTFTGGQAPHARINPACANTWFAAGNTIYVGDNHAESQATAIAISPAGSANTINRIICHNHSGSYPPASGDLRTSAVVSTTGAVNVSLTASGATYVYGLTLKAGVGTSTGTPSIALTQAIQSNQDWLFFDNCSFQLAGTASVAIIQIGTNAVGTPDVIFFNNCTVSFANVGNYIAPGLARFLWQNTGQVLFTGSVVPTQLFAPFSSTFVFGDVVLEALDLSQINTNLWSANTQWSMVNYTVKDCKLNASMVVANPVVTGTNIQLVRSDSSGTGYKSARYQYEGTETTETSITRVGGASDPTGQAQSRKIVTTANSQWLRPFRAEPYAIWNPTTGANVTVTVCGTINAGALPNNDDIWLEVEYLGSSLTPIGTIVTTTKANVLAANAAVASDGSSWNNTFSALDGALLNTVLSNNSRTFTRNSAAAGGAVSSAFLTTGKYYFEATPVVWAGTLFLGIVLSTGTPIDAAGQATTAGVFPGSGSSLVYSGGASSGKNLGVSVLGDVFGVSVDLTNRLIWVRRNNGSWNNDGTANPATGVGGVSLGVGAFAPFGSGSSGTGASDQVAFNFGQAAYFGAVPSGFNNWGNWSPFKLTATLSAPQPGMAGYLHARVRAAKASVTYYIDPQVTLS